MEDAATAEICRAQTWQWIRYGATLDDGRVVDSTLFDTMISEIMESIRNTVGRDAFESSQFIRAAEIVRELSEGEFREFSQPRRLGIYLEARIDRALCRRYSSSSAIT